MFYPNKKKSLREIIIESSVIISALLIFFGFIKQYWYFDHFGIKIQQYLGLDEVLILFLGEIPFIINLLLGIIAYFIIVFLLLKLYYSIRKSKNTQGINTIEEVNNDLDYILEDKKKLSYILAFSFSLNIIGIILFNYFHSEWSIIYLTLISCQTLFLIDDYFIKSIDQLFLKSSILLLCLTLILYCKDKIDYDTVFSKERKSEYIIILKDEKIITNHNLLFIGKTKSYLFLFNNSKKEVRILKNENVMETNLSLKITNN